MIINWNGQKVFVTGWEPNAPLKCEMCQKTGALRPYGENGSWVCVACAEKNPDITRKAYIKAIDPADFVFTTGRELPPLSENQMLGFLDKHIPESVVKGAISAKFYKGILSDD